VPGLYVDLVAFDLAAQLDLGLPLDDAVTKPSGHRLSIIGIDLQLLGDLLVREDVFLANRTILATPPTSSI
jgi:hypothetical protein